MKRAELLATLDIGMTIKKLREKKGLSQEQLAKDICDRTNITKLENGHSKVPSLSFVLAICERLELTIDEFLNYALLNNYKLDKKLILELLVNDDKETIKEYLNSLNPNMLSKLDLKYYNFLLAKIYLNDKRIQQGYDILKNIINDKNDDYVKVFAIHELLKYGLLKNNEKTDYIYARSFLSHLKEKNTNNQYFYFINDLLRNSIIKNDAERSRYLLELEIMFINNHDLYKFLATYYQNKIDIYRHEYSSIRDIEDKLLPLKNNKASN